MKRLSPEEFGKTLEKPLSRFHVYNLCEQGRIEGAMKIRGKWRIPSGARIRGRGWRTGNSGLKGLSVKEYARKHRVTTSRVYQLLVPRVQIPGAVKTREGWDLPRRGRFPGR